MTAARGTHEVGRGLQEEDLGAVMILEAAFVLLEGFPRDASSFHVDCCVFSLA